MADSKRCQHSITTSFLPMLPEPKRRHPSAPAPEKPAPALPMATEPKHRAISRQLLADISAGKYGPADRLPSEAQLVKTFRVSRPTVARALQDLQADGLIQRRAGSGTYVRDSAAAAPPALRQLALLIPGLGTTEIFELISGELASLARVQGYSLLWGSSTAPRADADPSLEHAAELCEQFITRRVSGVFFRPVRTRGGKRGRQPAPRRDLAPGGHSGGASRSRRPAVSQSQRFRYRRDR